MFNKMDFAHFQPELAYPQSKQITLMLDLDCARSREILKMVSKSSLKTMIVDFLI